MHALLSTQHDDPMADFLFSMLADPDYENCNKVRHNAISFTTSENLKLHIKL